MSIFSPAPKPMVKPDSLGVHNSMEITVVLPQASEEYGPISHYFLVVVPEQFASKEPDDFTIEEVSFIDVIVILYCSTK